MESVENKRQTKTNGWGLGAAICDREQTRMEMHEALKFPSMEAQPLQNIGKTIGGEMTVLNQSVLPEHEV